MNLRNGLLTIRFGDAYVRFGGYRIAEVRTSRGSVYAIRWEY